MKEAVDAAQHLSPEVLEAARRNHPQVHEHGCARFTRAIPGHIADPLAGRDCRPATDLGGRGLYMVNQLCDLVELRSSPEGSVVRLHMQLG